MDTAASTLDDVLDFLSSVFSFDMVTSVLDFVKSFVLTVLDWLYNLFFVDLWDKSKYFGLKIINFLFDKSSATFDFHFIEIVAGFAFICFAVKLTVSIIRG